MLITYSHPADFTSAAAVACALYFAAVYRSAAIAWVGFGGLSAALHLVSMAGALWNSGQIAVVLTVVDLVGMAVDGRPSCVIALTEHAERLTRDQDRLVLLEATARNPMWRAAFTSGPIPRSRPRR
jgi:hypothetical protein